MKCDVKVVGPIHLYRDIRMMHLTTVHFKFQHVHIVLIMAPGSNPHEPADVDNVVCAEIPDKETNPILYDVITSCNIHGPCGNINPGCVCMAADGPVRHCTKEFPKSFHDATVLSDGHYPAYRRRSPEQGGRCFQVMTRNGTQTVDNRWVVPYNPYFSWKYRCHINTEVVHSVRAVKYLYKYITKGTTRVMVRLANGEYEDITNDEVKRYQNARYIGASEAMWRLYDFPVMEKHPSVQKLPLHLENDQTVIFQAGNIIS